MRLTYLKSWNSQAQNVTVQIPSGRSTVVIPVPQELSADSGASGKLAISLLSIVDGNGCERRLPAPTVEVDIDRQKVNLSQDFADCSQLHVLQNRRELSLQKATWLSHNFASPVQG